MKIACITPQNKRDYLCEMLLEGFNQLGHELIISDPGNGFCDASMSANDFVSAANKSDLVVSFFGKVRNNAPPRHYLLPQIHQPRERKVFCDGSEWSATGWEAPHQASNSLVDPSQRRGDPWLDAKMLEQCGFYFKRECYTQDVEKGIIPLPFALVERHVLEFPQSYVDVGEKDIDVFCSFGHTKTGMRKEAIAIAETLKQDGKLNVVVKSGMPQEEYQDALRRARVVIDAWGGGDTTDRFWEGVGAQACVVYQRHNVVTPNPFIDWEHAVSWSTEKELNLAIHKLMYDGQSPEKIGRKGLEHALRYHTAKHRAQLILNKLAR